MPVLLCIKCKDSAHTPRKALQILPDSCKMVTTIFLRKGTDYERFFAGLLAVCLVGAAFAGCSGSSANYNVNDVASAVETVAKIENPLDITEDDLTYEFGVDMDKVEEFSGQKTGVANTAGTVLVVKASAGSVDDIKAALENYKNGLVSVSENYQNDFPEAYQQVSDGRVVAKGDYAVLAIAAAGVDYTEVDAAIDEALK